MSLAARGCCFPLLLAAVVAGWGCSSSGRQVRACPAPLLPALGLCALAGGAHAHDGDGPGLALTVTVCGALAGIAVRLLAPARGASGGRAAGGALRSCAAGAAFLLRRRAGRPHGRARRSPGTCGSTTPRRSSRSATGCSPTGTAPRGCRRRPTRRRSSSTSRPGTRSGSILPLAATGRLTRHRPDLAVDAVPRRAGRTARRGGRGAGAAAHAGPPGPRGGGGRRRRARRCCSGTSCGAGSRRSGPRRWPRRSRRSSRGHWRRSSGAGARALLRACVPGAVGAARSRLRAQRRRARVGGPGDRGARVCARRRPRAWARASRWCSPRRSWPASRSCRSLRLVPFVDGLSHAPRLRAGLARESAAADPLLAGRRHLARAGLPRPLR